MKDGGDVNRFRHAQQKIVAVLMIRVTIWKTINVSGFGYAKTYSQRFTALVESYFVMKCILYMKDIYDVWQ